jgi:hypothetical protein
MKIRLINMPSQSLSPRERCAWWVFLLVLIFFAAIHYWWMRVHTHLPLWAVILILLPGTCVWAYAMYSWKVGLNSVERTPRKHETLVGIVSAVSTLYLGLRGGTYLFLVYLYGFSRVRSEGLKFVSMGKGNPWIVSNGDQVIEGQYLHFLIGGAIWAALFFLIFPLIYYRLPEENK